MDTSSADSCLTPKPEPCLFTGWISRKPQRLPPNFGSMEAWNICTRGDFPISSNVKRYELIQIMKNSASSTAFEAIEAHNGSQIGHAKSQIKAVCLIRRILVHDQNRTGFVRPHAVISGERIEALHQCCFRSFLCSHCNAECCFCYLHRPARDLHMNRYQ